tara:strand:- start:8371 stop:9255 length:885 start_codon:yes stop_codon:yes gene_type:complete
MAYGSPNTSEQNQGRNTGTTYGNEIPGKPSSDDVILVSGIEDEPADVTYDSYSLEGEIRFQKIIYSQPSFRNRIDVSFNELNNKSKEVDISKFFNDYYRIFFDIPKIGNLSHTTLVEESTSYVQDFNDPKDQIIGDLNNQIAKLQTQIIELQTAQEEGDSLGNIVDELETQEQLLDLIGDPTDPMIGWETKNYELLGIGLKKRSVETYLAGGNSPSYQSIGGEDFENNNMNGPKKDMQQAFDKGGPGGDRAGQDRRKYSQWVTDIDKRSSNKDQRDCLRVLDYHKNRLIDKLNI